jgi:Icc-related predicted phosphoesterase
MIIDCISDLHVYFPKMKGGDLLIIAGDLTAKGSLQEYLNFFDWLKIQDYRKKILIGGNHDGLLRTQQTFVKTYLYSKDKQCEYLIDSEIEFEKTRIWGHPWVPLLKNANKNCRNFMLGNVNSEIKAECIPEGLDILISHGPPLSVLDKIKTGEQAGCPFLKKMLRTKKPKVMVFGHIHECGQQILQVEDTICVNCSIVDEYYRHRFLPLRIEL